MGLFDRLYYGKAGKRDYSEMDMPKNRVSLFFMVLKDHVFDLIKVNLMQLIFWIPFLLWTYINLAAVQSIDTETVLSHADGAAELLSAISGYLMMWLIGLIPCIAITGPSSAGAAYVMRNWARGQHAFLFSEFKDAFKSNWKQALGVSALTSVVPLVAYTAVSYYGEMTKGSAVMFAPLMLVLSATLIYMVMLPLLYPMMVGYELSFGNLIKNAFLMGAARLPQMLLPGLALMAFMLFASRPIAVGLLLAPFKTSPRQVALVSWAGLRGAASVVFSLFAVVAGVPGGHDLFDLVFVIAVSSIVVQGSLLPAVAKKLDMIDAAGDVRRTFNDYRDEDGMSFVKLKVGAGHPFAGRSLADIGSATDMLVVLVLRDGAHPVLPNGDTVIEEGDLLVMAAPTFEERAEVTLREVTVTPHGRLAGQRLRDVPQGKHPFIVVMLKREGQTIIPNGDTLIYAGDEAVIATLAS